MKIPQLITSTASCILLSSCAFTNFGNMLSSPDEVPVYSVPKKEQSTGKLYSDIYTYEVDESWYAVFAGSAGAARRIILERTNAPVRKHYFTPNELKMLAQKTRNTRNYWLLAPLPESGSFHAETNHLCINCVPSHPLRSEYLLWKIPGQNDASSPQFSDPPQTITLHASSDYALNQEKKMHQLDAILSLPLMATPISGILLLYEMCLFN